MHYYQVAIRGVSGGSSVFTYHSSTKLLLGQLVSVELRKRTETGVIWSVGARPKFKTLPITAVSAIILPDHLMRLVDWLSSFYAAPLGACLQLCIPPKIPNNPKPRVTTSNLTTRPNISELPLTDEQAQAIEAIRKLSSGAVVLHGETGSGKTRVYGELASETLANGRSVLVLVPEIGMTEQISADLAHYISSPVLIAHSELTPVQRQKLWLTIMNEPASVVIGTRSSLLFPFHNLGLVVVDEAHDTAYKQESAPRYQAVRLASQLANLHSARLILGSATPTVADYYLAEAKHVPVVQMTGQASGQDRSVAVEVVDRRNHRLFSKSRLLSNLAIDAVMANLAQHKQSLLFLNRRGTARICLCQTCGWTAECAICDLPLTYHHHQQALLCHGCGSTYPLFTACANCGSVELAYQSPGVQALMTEAAHLFPGAKLLRIDSDAKPSEGLSKQYQDLYEGRIDILIGTQSIAKGLDLPHLTLEVIVDADTSLHMPDYLSGERMFQLLYQVMGRIGRHRDGQLIVQTITPDNAILQAAVSRDYAAFYDDEIQSRRKLGYPPFAHLARIVIERPTDATSHTEARKLRDQLVTLPGLILRGPSPCFYAKLRNKYRYQIIVMAKRRANLTEIVHHLTANATLDIDPTNLL